MIIHSPTFGLRIRRNYRQITKVVAGQSSSFELSKGSDTFRVQVNPVSTGDSLQNSDPVSKGPVGKGYKLVISKIKGRGKKQLGQAALTVGENFRVGEFDIPVYIDTTGRQIDSIGIFEKRPKGIEILKTILESAAGSLAARAKSLSPKV